MSDFYSIYDSANQNEVAFTSVPQTFELYRQKSEKRKAAAEIARTEGFILSEPGVVTTRFLKKEETHSLPVVFPPLGKE